MDNLQDIRERVHAQIEAFRHTHRGWPSAQGYLYYTPTTSAHDGRILARSKRPGPGWKLVQPGPLQSNLSAASIVQRLTALGILGRLPVLALTN